MKKKFFPLDFQKIKWGVLVIAALASFYISIFFLVFANSKFPDYGADFMAWWSAGKIADEKGYSQIYDINLLRNIQTQEFISLGLIKNIENFQLIPNTAPIFPFFIVPFQLLSKLSSKVGYWIWTVINLLLLISYLLFFIRRTHRGNSSLQLDLQMLCLVLFTYPVFSNTGLGQIEVFLLICVGEFIRNAINKKPLISGMWLGGLLLKFQLLILVVPVLLIMKNWRCLKGLVISSGFILGISIGLSGFSGMLALVSLLANRYIGTATSNPDVMINWRMVGVNINTATGSSIGWVITVIGIVITLVAVYFLIRHGYQYGSPEWVMIMMGVFSATIAISWHSHYHMAMILIPFLIFVYLYKFISDKIMYIWVTLTPIMWFVFLAVLFVLSLSGRNDISNYQEIMIGISGIVVNLMLLVAAIRFSNNSRVFDVSYLI